MLGKESSDYSYYSHELKDNYRKGIHRMRAILAVPLMAEQLAKNLGAVSVVLGVPLADKNSAELFELLTKSKVGHLAVNTFLDANGFSEYPTPDDKFSDYGRCAAVLADGLMYRAAAANGIVIGKLAAGLANLPCREYGDVEAVAASAAAMEAVAASVTAMAAVAASAVAMTAVAASSTAMAAVATSSTAMTAIFQSPVAMQAVRNSEIATAAIAAASDAVITATVIILAKLTPGSYSSMAQIAASSTAMTAVAASQTARNAISASAVAKTALRNSPLKVTKSISTNAWVTTNTGKGWLIDYYQPNNPGGNVGWTIDGTLNAMNATGTTKVEMWAVNSSSIYWHYSGSWATYIPIT